MNTKQMKPVRVFAQITRVDKSERIVEGHCYVNAVVGDGVNLTRKSMEAATPDYLKFGAIRAMHEPVAAGQAVSAEWDATGCLLRAKITDDNEWKKCEDGTYKGFSVGVNPVVMRGNKTVKVDWIEVSLVDRPFDTDARMVVARGAGLSDDVMDKEVTVTVLDPGEKLPTPAVQRKSKAEGKAKPEGKSKGEGKAKKGNNPAASAGPVIPPAPSPVAETDPTLNPVSVSTVSVDVLPDGADLSRIKTKKLAKMAKKIGQVNKALNGQYRAAEAELVRRGTPLTSKSASVAPPAVQAPDPVTLRRLGVMEIKLSRLKTDLAGKDKKLKQADKAIERLGKQPQAGTYPIRFPAAVERAFGANDRTDAFTGQDEDGEGAAELTAKYHALVESAEKEPDAGKRSQAAVDISILAAQLSEAGLSF